ncbi:uncharacterized protein [Drosophila takahashii]|uniref:uncharacterized protein n=1 Tax=Drosophila takahashii TaxID=29030 RepID=UPI0038991D38
MNDFTEQFFNNETESAETSTSTNKVDMSNVSYTQLTSNYEYPSTSTMLQMQKLNKNVEDLKDRLDKLDAENTKIQTRLLTEVIAQRKLVQEDLSNSSELCEQLEAEMINYNISDPAKFLRTMWKKIFTDEMASKYSWKGTNTKICVLSLAITTAVRSAFNQKFAVDEKQFSLVCSKWFQTANDRIKYYKKTEKK